MRLRFPAVIEVQRRGACRLALCEVNPSRRDYTPIKISNVTFEPAGNGYFFDVKILLKAPDLTLVHPSLFKNHSGSGTILLTSIRECPKMKLMHPIFPAHMN